MRSLFPPANPYEWHEDYAFYRPVTTIDGEKVRFETIMARMRPDGTMEYRRKTDAEFARDSAW